MNLSLHISLLKSALILVLCCVLCPTSLWASKWLPCYPEDWKGDKLEGNEFRCINWTKELTWYASEYMYGIIENNFDYKPDAPTETPWLADEEGTVEDYEGNVYKTLRFGDTWWMAENLRTKTFADGTQMQKFVEWDGSCDGGYEEGNTSEFRYTHSNDDSVNDAVYGCLYNWQVGYATLYKKKKLLKDPGWIIPDTLDFYNLMKRFGVWKSVDTEKVEQNYEYIWTVTAAPNFGLFLKSDRRTLWETGSPRAGEIPYNASGLCFPPAGQMEGVHSGFGTLATIWTGIATHSTPHDGLGRRYLILSNVDNTMTASTKGGAMGRSVRLIKRIKRTKNGDGTYTATNSIAWCPGYIDGAVGTATTSITTPTTDSKTWGTQGIIMVQCQKENTQVEIYNISGNLVKKVQLTPGTIQIAAKPGLYIVTIDGIGKKVVVQ
ncbi:hypothetical protein DMA11_14905 [Marinilabiliaceae bacterium JC017]|nr:hypothetical protein DMA11_14905 [Marinilabiliaceae bacterium JC017]